MKITDITTTGWYWWRWDSHRYWEPIFVKMIGTTPHVQMPLRHSGFYAGEIYGPVGNIPEEGAVGGPGDGLIHQ